MNRASKALAFAALAWAIFAPCFVFYQSSRDDNVGRRLRALGAARLGATAEAMTNETVLIPRGSVEMVVDLADAEDRKSDRFMSVVLVSSAFMIGLSLVSITRRQHAERAS